MGAGKTSINDYSYLIVLSQIGNGAFETSNTIYNFADAPITRKFDSTMGQQFSNMIWVNNYAYSIQYTFTEHTFTIDSIYTTNWKDMPPRIWKILAFPK